MQVPENIRKVFNQMATALDDFDEMFRYLDEYRKTGDKRWLFKARDFETKARRLMKEIPKQNA